MYTQCPKCQTCFRIAEAHLKAAKGIVRCGSCQEVFNATAHLYSNVPEEETSPTPASPTPTPEPQEPAPAVEDYQHIDLSPDAINAERDNMPSQDPFMESLVGKNARYNNLDEMGDISIPGELEFSDSFINFSDQTQTTSSVDSTDAKQQTNTTNPYEDTANVRNPVTTIEQDGIDELYQVAEQQLDENKTDDDKLKKDIEDLLSYAASLDQEPQVSDEPNKIQTRTDELAEEFDSISDDELDLNNEQLKAFGENISALPKVLSPNENQLEDIHIEPLAINDIDEEISSLSITSSEPDIAPNTDELPTSPEEEELPSPEEDIPLALRHSLENFERPKHSWLKITGLFSIIIILLVGFIAQLVYFRSYELAQKFPALIPSLTTSCHYLPCRYAGAQDVSQIQLINRDVRSHPNQKNALLISAAFVNQAPFSQPYPTIAVKLSDLSGHVVATRTFTPQEYLDKLYSKFLLMEAGTPVHITLAVLDPGDDAINFEFTFL